MGGSMRSYEELAELMGKESEYARKDLFKQIGSDDKSALGWDLWDLVIESKEEKDFFGAKQWAAIKCDWKRYGKLLEEEDYQNEIDSHA